MDILLEKKKQKAIAINYPNSKYVCCEKILNRI